MNRARFIAALTVAGWIAAIGIDWIGLSFAHSVLVLFAIDPAPYIASGAIGIVVVLIFVCLLAGIFEPRRPS